MDSLQPVFITQMEPEHWWVGDGGGQSTADLQLEPLQQCGFGLSGRNRQLQRRRGFRRSARDQSVPTPQPTPLLADRAVDPFTVAIVDTGLEASHPWFAGKIWHNPLEQVDGVDNDGNGLVDDVTGWDFVGRDPNPEDTLGHGTQMAGLVVQAQQPVQVMPLKVIGAGLGGSANVAAAIDYAVNHRVDVINLSLNSPQASPQVEAAVGRALREGIRVVAAAGNQGLREPEFPANLPAVIAVGAVNSKGKLHTWSSGPGQKGADYVVADVDGVTTADLGGGVTRVQGTSAAAAWISGQVVEHKGIEPLRAERLRFRAPAVRTAMRSAAKRQLA